MGAYSQRDGIKFDLPAIDLDKNDFFGSSPPGIFVGRFGYPKINVGVLSPIGKNEHSDELNNPKLWAANNYKAEQIAKLRGSLVNSRFKSGVKNFDSRLLAKAQEIGIAYKPVDVEIKLSKKPKLGAEVSNVFSPVMNNASAKNIKIVENPKVKNVVEKVVSDVDMKAVDGIMKMYRKSVDETFSNQILSIGLLGLKKNRKLVPTRWSITATDDTIGKELLKEIRDYQEIDYSFYFGGHLGNYYLVLFFPGAWSYELFEIDIKSKVNIWSKSGKFYAYDYEDFFGRKKYAEETAGGYYAARLPVLEKLKNLKRLGSALVIRLIDEDYNIPLGVWVCREAARKALLVGRKFNDRKELLDYVSMFAKNEFGFNLEKVFENSKTLNEKTQVNLSRYI